MNLDEHLDHFTYRLLRDAHNDATAVYWRRRAAMFEWARPRPGEFHGQATRAELDAADARCQAAAQACLARAGVVGQMWEAAA